MSDTHEEQHPADAASAEAHGAEHDQHAIEAPPEPVVGTSDVTLPAAASEPIPPAPPAPPQPETTAPVPEAAVQTTAPDVAPVDPPPASDAIPAGASTPPVAATPPEVVAPPEPAIVESTPVAPGTPTSDVIDSPAAAHAALGSESGVGSETLAAAAATAADAIPEHPLTTIERMRAKLAGYGEECLEAVRAEIEYLMNVLKD